MDKKDIQTIVDSLEELSKSTCRTIWNNPELSGKEMKSSGVFKKLLADEGFNIIEEASVKYAFIAQYGSGAPVIAMLGEYDALPELSQKVCTYKDPIEEGKPGHGCGHNLLGTACAISAIAVKRFLEKEKIPGTIRFYGCPAEELLSGKVEMAYYHMFDDIDFAISWHPKGANEVYDSGYLANASVHFNFTGRVSHAATAPEQGRSALDAVELMSVGVNYLREHVTSKVRIHYTTDSGGFPPNIVPDHASAWYFVRAPHMFEVKEILKRICKIAEGACLMTETSVKMNIDCGCCEMLENHAFADLTYKNFIETELPHFTEEEMKFAKELESTVISSSIERAHSLLDVDQPLHTGIGRRDLYLENYQTGSSDAGDVSFIAPMCAFSVACWPVAVVPHTWQAAASAGSTIGEKGALHAARVMAAIAYDLYKEPETRQKIMTEFKAKKTPYVPMLQETSN